MVEREEYALVTGGNRGMGLEICRQFAAEGFMVILGSRSEKRGIEAVEKLRESGISNVIFHQLDVTDAASVAAAADFVKTNFGKLDFLVNNARNRGVEVEGDVAVLEEALAAAGEVKLMISRFMQPEPFHPRASGKLVYSYELVKESIEVNYYGPKRTTEAFAPLLHKFKRTPKIWNVPCTIGSLHAINYAPLITSNLCKLLRNEWAKEVLANELSLTEAMIDEVVEKFAEDFKQGKVEENKWPSEFAAYKVSKAAMNAYTRVASKKYPCIAMLVLRPGHSRTGTTFYYEDQVKMALVPESEGLSASLFRRWESFRSLVDRTVIVCLRR